jgi:hypothetical protein
MSHPLKEIVKPANKKILLSLLLTIIYLGYIFFRNILFLMIFRNFTENYFLNIAFSCFAHIILLFALYKFSLFTIAFLEKESSVVNPKIKQALLLTLILWLGSDKIFTLPAFLGNLFSNFFAPQEYTVAVLMFLSFFVVSYILLGITLGLIIPIKKISKN